MIERGCRAIVGRRNKLRPDGLEFCGGWVVPDSPYCAEHQGWKEEGAPEKEAPKKKRKKLKL